MAVTSNILQRTFRISCGTRSSATCFTVDVDEKRYLVTARHVAASIHDQAEVKILHGGTWKHLAVDLVGHGAGDVDVSVLAPRQLFGAPHQLLVTTEAMILSEDVYFLGFPFGLEGEAKNLNAGFSLPLVKKGVLSAIADGLILLDGHNNPGFSGGPVVRGSAPNQVIGIVSGYRNDRQPVRDETGNNGPYTYDMNTGIVYAYQSSHIRRLVTENPIGMDASPR